MHMHMCVGAAGLPQVAGSLTGLGFADEVRLPGHRLQEQPISTSPALGLQNHAPALARGENSDPCLLGTQLLADLGLFLFLEVNVF